MKKTKASVGAVSTLGKKEEVEEVKVEEEEYIEHQNEMYFFLKERPEYRISAVGRWLEDSRGNVVGDADTYFRHILNGSRCDSVWRCIDGWSEQSERTEELWETLCMCIEELDGCEQIICDEESFGI